MQECCSSIKRQKGINNKEDMRDKGIGNIFLK
jgi:hypothetical protein